MVHVPPSYERVKYGVTRFPSKPVIRLEGVVSPASSLFPASDDAEAKRPPYLSLRLLIDKHDFRGPLPVAYMQSIGSQVRVKTVRIAKIVLSRKDQLSLRVRNMEFCTINNSFL